MAKSKHAPPPRKPIQIGDYFAYRGLNDFSVRLKTGRLDDRFFSLHDEHITQCATLEGAERLATLMNLARDIARDNHLLCNPGGQFGTRDQVAAYVAHHVSRALDTPFRYVSLDEHARDTLREYGSQSGDLARFFAFLDAAGTPTTLDDFKARAMLRRHAINDPNVSYCDNNRSREIDRAWRRTFDPEIDAATRAAKVLAALETSNG